MVAHTRRISPWSGLNVGTAMPCARPVRPAWSEPSPQAPQSASSLYLYLSRMTDEEIVERQLGRPSRAFLRVAVRCPFGKPAVTEQAAIDEEGHPFPTQFYVTCKYLVAAISRLEAGGGVERWSR